MPRLTFADSGMSLGDISDDQLRFLTGALVKESPDDRDYYIDRDTLEMLLEMGCDEELRALLEKALDGREDVELRWDEADGGGGREDGPYR